VGSAVSQGAKAVGNVASQGVKSVGQGVNAVGRAANLGGLEVGQMDPAQAAAAANEQQEQKKQVQDPYSFRCTPQVVGASLDVWAHCHAVFEREINSVTDNPNVFPEEDVILSGGNFHGQPLAMALDYLCLAMHEVGSIAERRTYQLTLGKNGLPHFLAADAGLHSGMMIPQYTAAALVSQNKQLCTPASADTIDSSAGQEDHVSMGANAATKAWRVLNNLESILGIELLNAAQAIEFRRPLRSSSILEKILADFRAEIPFMKEDRILSIDMRKAAQFVRDSTF
jgi:histidine ammonia-lyase